MAVDLTDTSPLVISEPCPVVSVLHPQACFDAAMSLHVRGSGVRRWLGLKSLILTLNGHGQHCLTYVSSRHVKRLRNSRAAAGLRL